MKKKIAFLVNLLPLILCCSYSDTENSRLNSACFDFVSDQEVFTFDINYHCSNEISNARSVITVSINDVGGVSEVFHDEYDIERQYELSKNLLISGTNTIEVSVYVENRFLVKETIPFDYYEMYDISNFENEIIGTINSIYFYKIGWIEKYEKISFNNFEEVKSTNVYYKVNLDDLNISLDNYANNNIYFGYLRIYCDKKYFSRMQYSENENCVEVPINLINIDGKGNYKLKFSSMYYDSSTNIMSSYSGDNFTKTNEFFMPKKYYSELGDLNMELVFSNIGYSMFNFSYKFIYHFEKDLVGDCNSSEYCIEMTEVDYA